MVDSQAQLYKDVLGGTQDIVLAGTSRPILCAPFKTVQAVVVPNGVNAPVTCFMSNQELPPNLALPASATNQYSAIGYTDMSDQAFYDSATPLTVVAGTEKTLNIEQTGMRWFFIQVGAITLPRIDVTCFSNFK